MKKKKAIGFWFSLITAILAVACLVVMMNYRNRGGIVNEYAIYAIGAAIVCEVLSFFGEHFWTDFTAIIGAALLAFTCMSVLGDGVWNIAESINGIRMVGLPELAPMNYTMAELNGAAILTAILAAFTKKSKVVKVEE